MLYFWPLKRRWIAERRRHLPVGSRTAGNCWIWITAQELGHWSIAFHNSLHGINPRRIPAVHKKTGFCCLLLKLSLSEAQALIYFSSCSWQKIVPYFSSFLLIMQQTEWRWCEVIWNVFLRAGTGTFCAHPNWAVSPSLILSRRASLTPLPSTYPQGNPDWS